MVKKEPEVLLKLIWQEMEQNNDAVMQGDIQSLASIEAKIQEFCEVIKALPLPEISRFQDDFKTLMERLVIWSEHLEMRKRNIEQELKTLNTQSKAQAAYKTQSPHIKPESE